MPPGVPFVLNYMEADVKGLYILIQGRLDGLNIIILNAYAPNRDDGLLFPMLQDLLSPSMGFPIIWTGDYNCILDGVLDRYPARANTKPRMTSSLHMSVTNLGLHDDWRVHILPLRSLPATHLLMIHIVD